jgi:1-aminocyclopropane-1-carboxylate deaminase
MKTIQHLTGITDYHVDVLRLDLLHPQYGGNKIFKLKYNLLKANGLPVLTFGGAHSNHIYATAAYCSEQGISCIGVIRGEESMLQQSPTLQFAKEKGMHLHFISREQYKGKADEDFIAELHQQYGNFYLIPEGGNNDEGIKGCMEILQDVPSYDYVFCACGTACTYTGILASARNGEKVIGISVLKGENELLHDVNMHAQVLRFKPIEPYPGGIVEKSTILNHYHFGGYARHSQELLDFKRQFEGSHQISLDYVYTAKLFYAVSDLMKQKLLKPRSRILIIHSGGLQGNTGYEQRYRIIP